jgi:hypothetical protein
VNVEDRACRRKHRFSNVHDAFRAAERASKRSGRQIVKYRCPFCGTFHIGRVPSMAVLREIADAIRDHSHR